jgi:hypothetical protein
MLFRGVKVANNQFSVIVDDLNVLWVCASDVWRPLLYDRLSRLTEKYGDDNRFSKELLQFPRSIRGDGVCPEELYLKLFNIEEILSKDRALRQDKKDALRKVERGILSWFVCGYVDEMKSRELLVSHRSRAGYVRVDPVESQRSVDRDARRPDEEAAVANVLASLEDALNVSDEDDGVDEPKVGNMTWIEHDYGSFQSPAGSAFRPSRHLSRSSGSLPPRRERPLYVPPTPVYRPPREPLGLGDQGLRPMDTGPDELEENELAEDEEPFSGGDIEELLYREVVASAGLDPDVPLHFSRVPLVIEAASTRTTSEMRDVARLLGHALLPVDGAKCSKILLLDASGAEAGLLAAKRYFNLTHEVFVSYRNQLDARVWTFVSSTLAKDDLWQLVEVLAFGQPGRKTQNTLDTEHCQELEKEHPWLRGDVDGSRETTLSKNEKPLYGDLCFASPRMFEALFSQSPCKSCRRAAGVQLAGQMKRGCESVLEFQCSNPECGSKFRFRPLHGPAGMLNKAVFVSSCAAGSTDSTKRFLKFLFGARVLSSSNGRESWVSKLATAVRVEHGKAQELLLCHLVSRNGTTTASGDCCFARNARAGNNLAPFSAFSIMDGVTNNVLFFQSFCRKDLLQLRNKSGGKISLTSPFPGAPAIETAYQPSGIGIECLMFEIALQLFWQHLLVAEERALVVAGGGLDFENIDWSGRPTKVIGWVMDGMQASQSIIDRVWPGLELFLDWWHKRKNLSKALRKVGKKDADIKQLGDAINSKFADLLYVGGEAGDFDKLVEEQLVGHNMSRDDWDKKTREKWAKIEEVAKETLRVVDTERSTSFNELLHAHKNNFAPKGKKMTAERWEIAMNMTFLSWNGVPNWLQKVYKNFQESF